MLDGAGEPSLAVEVLRLRECDWESPDGERPGLAAGIGEEYVIGTSLAFEDSAGGLSGLDMAYIRVETLESRCMCGRRDLIHARLRGTWSIVKVY